MCAMERLHFIVMYYIYLYIYVTLQLLGCDRIVSLIHYDTVYAEEFLHSKSGEQLPCYSS